ncbi:flagellar protein FliS, partial [Xanthomonas citri pv. citri]
MPIQVRPIVISALPSGRSVVAGAQRSGTSEGQPIEESSMYGSNRQYAEQYRKVGVSTSVTEADPHKLVSLLFAGACQRIRLAQACLAQGDQARKGKA